MVVSKVVHAILEDVPTTSITVYFLTNLSDSSQLGIKFRIEFGCAFGDGKDDHHFIKVKSSKMSAFIPHVMPGTPPNQASILSTLMAAARVKSTVFLRFITNDNNELEIDDNDDVDDNDNDDFMVLEDWFGLTPPPVVAAITNNNHVPPAVLRFTRAKFPRMVKQYKSTWCTRYLAPEVRADLIDHPNGRLHGKVRILFLTHS